MVQLVINACLSIIYKMKYANFVRIPLMGVIYARIHPFVSHVINKSIGRRQSKVFANVFLGLLMLMLHAKSVQDTVFIANKTNSAFNVMKRHIGLSSKEYVNVEKDSISKMKNATHVFWGV